MTIKSPFNFVPLNAQVFSPDWADEISQDIPFSDGVSGTIDLTITAESPIYIHNGQLHKEDKEDKDKSKDKDYSFSHVTTARGNRYFIPGTSIKGEVRNILEIMSYGKMRVDERAQFARRDLHNKDVYSLLKKQGEEHCGWLRRKGEDYEIEDCGRFWRISHDEIDRFLGSPVMRRNFSLKGKVGKLEDEQKTADYKYRLIEDKSLFKERTFDAIGKNRMGDSLVEISDGGSLRGTIVFTGQPSLWSEPLKENKGKYYEFVFPARKQCVRHINRVDFDHYAFIYKDSADWSRIKQLLNESEHGGCGVPVFFLPKGNDGVEHFGMAYLYKMPYDRSVFESLPKDHQDKGKRDLAECIFGYTDKQDALKGRVQFGHAFVPDGVQVKSLPRIRLVLGSPKASYYPLYVSQNGKGGVTSDYETYDHGTPSGWKRYYVRKDTDSVRKTDGDVDTFMEPLDKGTTFHGTVTFHNLRPVELGALLSALTFHDTPQCRHQLGMAKAYGYGKCRYAVKICVTASSRTEQPKDAEYFMARFEDYMSRHVAAHWTEQQPIKELFTMAGYDVANGGAFDFMKMTNDKKTNEFELAEEAFEYLQRATALLPQTIAPKTLCDTLEFKKEMEIISKQEEEKEARTKEQRRQQQLHQFKTAYEQRIAQSGTDKGLLNNLKAELDNLYPDDKDQQAIITGLLAEIDKTIAQKPKEGFQEAFKTVITDYKMFEARVNAGLRNLKKAGAGELTQADKDFGAVKLQEAYGYDDKKSPKDWAVNTGRFFKRCVKTVGNDIATEWFTKLKR